MKRIVNILAAVFIMSLLSTSAGAEASVPPADGLEFWIEASESSITKDNNNRVEKWIDKTTNRVELVQTTSTRKPTYLLESEGLKAGGAVKFTSNQHLIKEGVNYSGNASFVIYMKLNNALEGHTVFSSHSYTGAPVTTANQIPLSIALDGDGNMLFKMASSDPSVPAIEKDINVCVKESEELKGYIMLCVSINGTNVSVYYSDPTNQTEITEPICEFTLNEAPYWESYAYGMAYDTTSRIKGIQGEIAESMIYHRAVSLAEVNDISRYLKLKYESPVLSGMYLKTPISEITKETLLEPEVVGVGMLMGVESELPLTGYNITSSNEDAVYIVNGKLKAVGFGTSVITISYEGLEPISFVVSVPQLTIGEVSVGTITPGGEVSVSRTVENIVESRPVSLMMVGAVYKGNLLLDAKTDYVENLTGENEFELLLDMPQDIADVVIEVSLVNLDTFVPIADSMHN